MSGIPPYATPGPLPVAPCCNTGCDLKDRAIEAAEAYVSYTGMDLTRHAESFQRLADSLRAYREWRDRK